MISSAILQVREAVMAAMTREDVRTAVHTLYADIERELDRIRPKCEMSGRCCRFEEYGHRLFVTTAELATFAWAAQHMPQMQSYVGRQDGSGCRFQEMKLCRAHGIRPMGCRLFFCDSRHEQELQVLFERMHTRLRAIHDTLGVQYLYVEWRQGLEAIGPLIQSP